MPLNSPNYSASYAWMLEQLDHIQRIIGIGSEGTDELTKLRDIIHTRLEKDGYTSTWNAFNMTYKVDRKED